MICIYIYISVYYYYFLQYISKELYFRNVLRVFLFYYLGLVLNRRARNLVEVNKKVCNTVFNYQYCPGEIISRDIFNNNTTKPR